MELGKGEYGAIKIHNEVIIAIARRAALEIEGVEKIASGFKKGLASVFGRKKFSRGITLEKNKDNDINITVSIVVRFGVNIPELVNKVQQNVKKMLEQITGIIPAEINVEVEKVAQELESVLEEVESRENIGRKNEAKS